MAKHYYQFPVDSEPGKLLAKFLCACIDAEAKAEKYARQMGAVSYYEDPNFFAGGVSCVAFKNPVKVNTDVWQMTYEDKDGMKWFKPNVRTSLGCVKAREGFTPKDKAGRIYKKEPVGWDAVRQLFSLSEWLVFCGFHSSGDKEIDAKTVIGLLKDKRFYTYIDIIPMAVPMIGRKRSRDGSKAILAEQMRMKLPTVHVNDFYRIVGADTRPVPTTSHKDSPSLRPIPGLVSAPSQNVSLSLRPISGGDTEASTEPCTPVFFVYHENWFIGMDYPVIHESNKSLIEINEGMFVAMKNKMLRDFRNKQ